MNFQVDMTDIDSVIKGTVTEDIPIKEPATIKGFIEGEFISFGKKYPYAYLLVRMVR